MPISFEAALKQACDERLAAVHGEMVNVLIKAKQEDPKFRPEDGHEWITQGVTAASAAIAQLRRMKSPKDMVTRYPYVDRTSWYDITGEPAPNGPALWSSCLHTTYFDGTISIVHHRILELMNEDCQTNDAQAKKTVF